MNYLKFVVLAFIIASSFILTSCNKERIEARKTAYFFSKTEAPQLFMLYVDDALIGELPLVPEGISECSAKSKGIEQLLKRGKNRIKIKNEKEELIAEAILELSRDGKAVTIGDARIGTFNVSSVQDKEASATCLIVEINE